MRSSGSARCSVATATIEHTEAEVLPVISKGGVTLDKVNRLDKVEVATDSALAAVQAADTAVRTVTGAVTYPAREARRADRRTARGARRSCPGATSTRRWRRRGTPRPAMSTIWPKKSRRPTAQPRPTIEGGRAPSCAKACPSSSRRGTSACHRRPSSRAPTTVRRSSRALDAADDAVLPRPGDATRAAADDLAEVLPRLTSTRSASTATT